MWPQASLPAEFIRQATAGTEACHHGSGYFQQPQRALQLGKFAQQMTGAIRKSDQDLDFARKDNEIIRSSTNREFFS